MWEEIDVIILCKLKRGEKEKNMGCLGNLLWFLLGGCLGGIGWCLQDAFGVLQSSEFLLDYSILS